MGFPDTFKRSKKASENYRQIGNSVAVPVIEEIAKSILKQKLLTDEPQTEIVGNLQLLLFS
jgi:DNA (cytosine-5)-methyltransferase 1